MASYHGMQNFSKNVVGAVYYENNNQLSDRDTYIGYSKKSEEFNVSFRKPRKSVVHV